MTDGKDLPDFETDGDGEKFDPETRRHDYPPGRKKPMNHGVKVRAKVKRGNDTRDQDELLIEGRGENFEEAAEEFDLALVAAEEREWSQRLRDLQPEDGDADE